MAPPTTQEPNILTLLNKPSLVTEIGFLMDDGNDRKYIDLAEWLADKGKIRRPETGFDYLDNYQHGGGSPGLQFLIQLGCKHPALTVAEFKESIKLKRNITEVVEWLGRRSGAVKLTVIRWVDKRELGNLLNMVDYPDIASDYEFDYEERLSFHHARVVPGEFGPTRQLFKKTYENCPSLPIKVLIEWADENQYIDIKEKFMQLLPGQVVEEQPTEQGNRSAAAPTVTTVPIQSADSMISSMGELSLRDRQNGNSVENDDDNDDEEDGILC